MKIENNLRVLAQQVRAFILKSTTEAGSGHPSSSLSATDLMTSLFFRHFRFDADHPDEPNNDRLIFSKGHAAPLLYALYAAAGLVTEKELLSLRKLGSPLEGHPTPHFKFSEAATGSLGQGLSIGIGMALNAKQCDKLPYRTFVLMGDGEMAEGSVWEAIQAAAHNKLDNLIGIIDVNQWGQSAETMVGHNTEAYAEKIRAFGWHVVTIDGHSFEEIEHAFQEVLSATGKPKMIVAKTFKGKGVSLMEGKKDWHGKPLPKEALAQALEEVNAPKFEMPGVLFKPEHYKKTTAQTKPVPEPSYAVGEKVATRKAYGEALAYLGGKYPEVVALDGDTKNSTFAEIFMKQWPERYFEMYIAEQNMVGVAVGLARRGKIPFVSTFAAFLTRTFDQVRMGALSQANVKYCGSHCGVSIGEDGASQMGLEDLAMFRAVNGSTVLYPSDAVQTKALVEEAIRTKGPVYIRTSRPATPVLYKSTDSFKVGGSKVIRSSEKDLITVVGAGVTLFEALKAYDTLQKEGINIRVIDCYSVKPIDAVTLKTAAKETKGMVVVEDHWFDGGLGDAVLNVFAREKTVPILKLAVTKMPTSATPDECLNAAGISAPHIVKAVKDLL
ncbi:MAG: transketolase [bacterium]|nr:transketolase [bacterium]